jgi:hypothetical protein
VAQDPLDDGRRLNQRDEAQPAPTPRTGEHVEAKPRCINAAHVAFGRRPASASSRAPSPTDDAPAGGAAGTIARRHAARGASTPW